MASSTLPSLRFAVPLLALAAVVAAGCQGSTTAVPPRPTVTPGPTASPTLGPTSLTATLAVGASAATATFAPLQNGLAASLTLPAATSGSATVLATYALAPPAGTPALSNVRRAPSAIGTSGLMAIAYIYLFTDKTITLSARPSITFAPTSAFTSVPILTPAYLAVYDPTQTASGWSIFAGPLPLSDTVSATFASTGVPMTVPSSGVTTLALFVSTSAIPTPTPLPSTTPSPSPSPTSSSTPQPTPVPSSSPVAFSVSAGSGLGGITAGPDGNLWFTESTTNKIGRITPGGTVTEFPITTANSTPAFIAKGPDGNLWFTENGANKIGRMTPSGVVTGEFAVPSAGSDLRGITAGPDGNLWFTEYAASKIGRITPTGAITEFNTFTPACGPLYIVAGPDGNLWFTPRVSHGIGRITPAGIASEFTIPTANEQPIGITVGSDGNLYFTESNESGAPEFGKIATSGAITQLGPGDYSFPDTAPGAITSGPDGNLWFTGSTGKIGRLTPSGAISFFPTSTTNSAPVSITAGPDGNIWFTESADKIGRITP